MIPNGIFSETPVYAPFLYPDNRPWLTWEDWEMGGIAHQDPSQGLLYQPWKAWYTEEGELFVQPQVTLTEPLLIMTQPRASYIGLTFDRSMNLCVTWRILNVVYLYWYDTSTEQYVTSAFTGGRSPRVVHDDKRQGASNWDDILLFYLKEDKLCMRRQRDRYNTELIMGTVSPELNLYRAGMTVNNRLQLELR